ncbi:hypothetical protein N7451_000968 [Penicillium sp. IBT 35674x]|nr:hypothetical protein N7451_000968 [Penicillium sp. IBT 35674x]
MAMTPGGTTIFPSIDWHAYFVIDNQSCQDGRNRLLNFAINGQVACQALTLPSLTLTHHSLGHCLNVLRQYDPMDRKPDNRLDVYLSILQTMKGFSERKCLGLKSDFTTGRWAEDFGLTAIIGL